MERKKNNIIESHIVPDGVTNIRLSNYIYPALRSLQSRKSGKKAIKEERVTVNGRISPTAAMINTGQVIELSMSEEKPGRVFPILYDVVYEDPSLAVIVKPAGVPVNGNLYRTIENSLLNNISLSQEDDALPIPRPLHRLDKPVRGLLIIAKTSSAMIDINRQFQERNIKKRYRAILIGKLNEPGSITEPVDGREAVTDYTPLVWYRSLKNDYLTLIDFMPQTGRRHQLRRHALTMGYPILGDPIYGIEGMILRSKGIFLEAVELSFIHPVTHSPVTFSIDESKKFISLPEREERLWKRYRG